MEKGKQTEPPGMGLFLHHLLLHTIDFWFSCCIEKVYVLAFTDESICMLSIPFCYAKEQNRPLLVGTAASVLILD